MFLLKQLLDQVFMFTQAYLFYSQCFDRGFLSWVIINIYLLWCDQSFIIRESARGRGRGVWGSGKARANTTVNRLINDGYHCYSDEISDNGRAEGESIIILARLNNSDNRHL